MLKIIKHSILKSRQFSGVAGVLVLWVSVSTSMFKAHLHLIDNRPISFLGVYSQTRLLFSLGLVVSSILFLVFGHYLATSYKTSNKFLKYFVIGQVGQIAAAVFPDTPHSTSKVIHTIAAFVLAFSLPFLIREFAVSQKGSKHSQIYRSLFIFELIAFIIGIGLFVFTKGIAPLGEILPTLGFHAWVIVLTVIATTELRPYQD